MGVTVSLPASIVKCAKVLGGVGVDCLLTFQYSEVDGGWGGVGGAALVDPCVDCLLTCQYSEVDGGCGGVGGAALIDPCVDCLRPGYVQPAPACLWPQ